MLSAVGVAAGAGNLGFNVLMARLAGAEAYGSIGALLAVSTVAAFLAIGLQYAVARRVAIGTAHPAELLRLPRRTAAVWLAGMAVLAALTFPGAAYLHLEGTGSALLTVVLVGVATAGALPLGVAIGLRLFGWIAALQLVGVAARLAGGVAFTHLVNAIDAALAATIAASAIPTVGLALVVLRRRGPAPVAARAAGSNGDRVSVETTLGAMVSAGLWALWSLPLLFARHGLSATGAGDFAAVQILCSSILFISAPIISVFYPLVARTRDRGMIQLGLAVTATLSAAGIAGLSLLGPSLVGHVYGGRYAGSGSLFLALATSAAAVALVTYGFWMLRALNGPWASLGLGMGAALLLVVGVGSVGATEAGVDGLAPAFGTAAGAVTFVLTSAAIQRRNRRTHLAGNPKLCDDRNP